MIRPLTCQYLVTGGGGRRRRRGARDVSTGGSHGGGGWREGGKSVEVPGEEADEAVLEEDKVRGAEAERREATEDEGPLREAGSSSCLIMPMKQEESNKPHQVNE